METPLISQSPHDIEASSSPKSPSTGTPLRNSLATLIANIGNRTRHGPTRSHSAPSVVIPKLGEDSPDAASSSSKPPLLYRQVLIGGAIYFILIIPIFLLTRSFEDNSATVGPVDAMYFTVVTLCTIGYGDIVPNTTFTKLFTCFFILAGFGFIYILFNGLVSLICDKQEALLLSAMDDNRLNNVMQTYMIDKDKGRMRVRLKVSFSLAVVVLSLVTGTIGAHYLESYNWVDSFYLAVTSATSVGYGDLSFKTLQGRCFAILWLLISTVAVSRAALFLAEFRIDRRNRRIANKILHRNITRGDFLAADLDNDGSVSKSEFVVYKLKQMGRVSEKEIMLICNQFDSMDCSLFGKITFAELMDSE